MTSLKIGIVEDDLIIAEAISEMLIESGYTVTEPAVRYSEAISMIERENPDLLLVDVNIIGKLDGVEVARTVSKAFNIPYIFLTANSDFDTISRAKEVSPAAFLVKPITKAQLYAAIEIAVANYEPGQSAINTTEKEIVRSNILFVKDGYCFRKVEAEEIVYAESEQNYIALHLTSNKKVILRSTISEFADGLDSKHFVRVHRSYIVATDKVEKITGSDIIVGGYTVPVSKAYRDTVLRVLGIRK